MIEVKVVQIWTRSMYFSCDASELEIVSKTPGIMLDPP